MSTRSHFSLSFLPDPPRPRGCLGQATFHSGALVLSVTLFLAMATQRLTCPGYPVLLTPSDPCLIQTSSLHPLLSRSKRVFIIVLGCCFFFYFSLLSRSPLSSSPFTLIIAQGGMVIANISSPAARYHLASFIFSPYSSFSCLIADRQPTWSSLC